MNSPAKATPKSSKELGSGTAVVAVKVELVLMSLNVKRPPEVP
jgi:hypothetical protein